MLIYCRCKSIVAKTIMFQKLWNVVLYSVLMVHEIMFFFIIQLSRDPYAWLLYCSKQRKLREKLRLLTVNNADEFLFEFKV